MARCQQSWELQLTDATRRLVARQNRSAEEGLAKSNCDVRILRRGTRRPRDHIADGGFGVFKVCYGQILRQSSEDAVRLGNKIFPMMMKFIPHRLVPLTTV